MSLRINQNISAMSAHRWLQSNDASMAKSIERLSSGFRINSAADDAAGLVISETLRTQVSGLTQAAQNTQDGINMIKTTEKALDEIETQLRNIRDLALHAANANGNAATLAADQAQVDKALQSIDRIADQTEFAGLKLLSDATGTNSIESKVFQIGANGGQTAAFSVKDSGGAALQFGTDHNGLALTLTTDMHAGAGLGLASAAGAYASAASTGTTDLSDGETEDFHLVWQKADQTTAIIDFQIAAAGADADADAQAVLINAELANLGYDAQLEAVSDGTNVSIQVVDRMENMAEQSGNSTLTVYSNPSAAGEGSGFGFAGVTASGTTATSGVTLSADPADYTSILGSIDDAMKKVEGLRVHLGSFQKNTLESNLASVAVAKENLAASESAIRDTDMAAEMVNFTKAQILMQAGQAMMSQANQAPQNILQMLR